MKTALTTLFFVFTFFACQAGEIPQELIDKALADTVVDTVQAIVPAMPTTTDESGLGLSAVLALLLGVYEVVVRVVPTVGNVSLLSWTMKLVEFLLPNLKKGGGKHKV